MADSEIWRQWINNLRAGDLPLEGTEAPEFESISEETKTEETQQVFVQKLVTETYVYTDIEKHVFGSRTFQTAHLLGEMTIKSLSEMLEKERKKKK
jgi:hypothetical protein